MTGIKIVLEAVFAFVQDPDGMTHVCMTTETPEGSVTAVACDKQLEDGKEWTPLPDDKVTEETFNNLCPICFKPEPMEDAA